MKQKRLCSAVLLVFISAFFASCATVPLTGRKQFDFIPGSIMLSMSFQQYDEFLKSHQLSNDLAKIKLVNDVGRKVQKAVEQYMTGNKISQTIDNYKWEFKLIEDPAMNAWCMPGGKLVVYTGILPIAQDEVGLAVVMGHEIAHAIAKHGDERLSQVLLTELGNVSLAAALKKQPEKTKQLWLGVYGVGTQLGVLLPYSRLHESEADRLGLLFMAMAGYNPNRAVEFWQRMSQAKKGNSVPEFLSTHPSDEKRIRQIQSYLPEAMEYYNKMVH